MSDVLSALIERLVKLEAEVARLKAQELNLPAGAASAPAVTLAGDTNTGIYHSAQDNLDFSTGGTNRVNISSTGLGVTGAVSASGTISAGSVVTSGDLRLGPYTELTIASGAITVTGSLHSVDTESDSASDDLVAINGGSTGSLLILRTVDNGRDVVLKDAATGGNLFLAGDCTLSALVDTITLIKIGSHWFELCRSDNG